MAPKPDHPPLHSGDQDHVGRRQLRQEVAKRLRAPAARGRRAAPPRDRRRALASGDSVSLAVFAELLERGVECSATRISA